MAEEIVKAIEEICDSIESKKVMQQAVELAVQLHVATKEKKEEHNVEA